MTFSNPFFLQFGVGIALLVVLGLRSHARRRRRLADFLGGQRAVRRLSDSDLHRLRLERMILLSVATIALAGAGAEPRWRSADATPAPPEERSVVLAIDVSASMQAADASPTRLAAALEVARELLETLAQDRVGLILYAGKTYPLAPPTHDHAVLDFFLDGVTPNTVSLVDPGTLMSVAIRESAALLADGPEGVRSIILIGEGEAGEEDGSVEAAALAAAAEGIAVSVIGVGTDRGSGILLPDSYRPGVRSNALGGQVVDRSGSPVVSRLNEPLLRRIAEAGSGIYVHASERGWLGDVQEEIRNQVPPTSSPEPPPFWARHDLTVWCVVLALVCLLVESLLDVRLPGGRWLAARRTA